MPEVGATVTPALLEELFDAFNRHDVDGIMAFFSNGCVFDAVAGPQVYGTRYEGRGAVGAAFAEVWATFPDARWADTRHTVSGDLGISEWTFVGTRADGARLEAEGCDLFTFANGKIVLKRAFRKQRLLLEPGAR